MDTTPSLEILLQHARFVQALSRSLLADPSAADDVAQETWLRALERGPESPTNTRGWLRSVVRNLATNARAGERHRREREQRAGKTEALASAADDAAQAELLRGVTEAVLALDEPYRATILARYFRGLEARELALETAVPLATVRSREQRALEQLRARLDREHGGRTSWALAVAGWLEPGRAARPFLAPSKAAAGFALVGLLAFSGVWLWRNAASSAPPASPLAAAEPSPPTSASPAAAPALAALPTPASRSRAPLTQDPPPPQAELRARFLLEDGQPAAGVTLIASGSEADEERVVRFGLPADWHDPSATSDAEGRVVLRFDPPLAFQFHVRAELAGHASPVWWWNEIAPGETKDLGALELPRGAAIEGRIVDAHGAPLLGTRWQIEGESVGLEGGANRRETSVSVICDPASGRFRLEGLWPGPNRLKIHTNASGWIKGQELVLQAGESASADFVYAGPDLARRISVTLDGGVFDGTIYFDPPAIRLLGVERALLALETFPMTFLLDDVEPGSYSLVIDDPRFAPWRRDGVRPGEPLTAHLSGSATLRLRILEGDGAQPVERCVVWGDHRGVGGSRAPATEAPWFEHELLRNGPAPEGGDVFALVPGDYSFSASDGQRSVSGETAGLLAGETRELTLRFPAATTETAPAIAGRVLDDAVAPVPFATVRLLAPAEIDDSSASVILPAEALTLDSSHCRTEIAKTVSDAQGLFHFVSPGAGSYLVHATARSMGGAASDVFTLGAADSRADLVLALARPGELRGHLLAPAGASFEGLSVELELDQGADPALWREPFQDTSARLGPDGSFAFRSVPPGPLTVFLKIPSTGHLTTMTVEVSRSGEVWMSDERLLGALDIPSGAVLERDLDARATFPGSLTLAAIVDRRPTAGLEVVLRSTIDEDPTERRLVTRADGRVGPTKLFPGLWKACVVAREAGWIFAYPLPLAITPADEHFAALEIQLVAGTLTCLDASTETPLANRTLTLTSSAGKERCTHAFTTDGAGRLDLNLPPGRYELCLSTPGAARHELVWNAGGPSTPTIGL